MFYTLLFQCKLVPQWLAAWGLLALIMNLAAGLCVMFGLFSPVSTISDVLQIPIFFQEMVLAVWLIVKGFNPAAVASLSATTAEKPYVSTSKQHLAPHQSVYR